MKMLTELSASLVLSLSMTNPTPSSIDLKASIGSWVENNSHTITPRAKVTWKHNHTRTAVYVGLWIGDLISTEWAVRTPMADGTMMHEGNPFPGMGSTLGRAVLLPAFGFAASRVDRYLSVRGHVRWARAWRWACWLNEILQTLANFRVTPLWASPMGLLPRSTLRTK
jgi:hypothetical protein